MNSTVVETRPPAKLNLFLELLGKRSDGYHELQTVMVAIDRRDSLRIARTAAPGIELVCRWSPSAAVWRRRLPTAPPGTFELPPAENNLVVRAVRRFSEVFACGGGFAIRLDKRIPAGAGMGGASSDAASALLAAAALCGYSSGDPRIAQIAAELGSDVPFFLGPAAFSEPHAESAAAPVGSSLASAAADHGSSGQTGPRLGQRTGMALAGGRGVQLTPLAAAPGWHFVVIYPPEPLSTAAVFQHCSIPATAQSAAEFLKTLSTRGGPQQPKMFNRLAEPARQMSAWIDKSLDALGQVGLRGATMTGSGSACFAIARSARSARRAASVLASRRLGVCFATTPANLPANIRFEL